MRSPRGSDSPSIREGRDARSSVAAWASSTSTTCCRVRGNLTRRAVLGQTFNFQTDEDLSADDGVIPADPCLQPMRQQRRRVHRSGLPGVPDGPARLAPAGSERRVREYRAMAATTIATWAISGRTVSAYSARSIPNLAVGVDYVGHRGLRSDGPDRHQRGAARRRRARHAAPADCSIRLATLIPAVARNANFQRVLQYQTRDDFEHATSTRWSCRWRSGSRMWSGRDCLHPGLRLTTSSRTLGAQCSRVERSEPTRRLRPCDIRQPARVRDELQRRTRWAD